MDENVLKIARLALCNMRSYSLHPSAPQSWAAWKLRSMESCQEWWDYAQDDLEIPETERIEWPEDLDLDNLPSV